MHSGGGSTGISGWVLYIKRVRFSAGLRNSVREAGACGWMRRPYLCKQISEILSEIRLKHTSLLSLFDATWAADKNAAY